MIKKYFYWFMYVQKYFPLEALFLWVEYLCALGVWQSLHGSDRVFTAPYTAGQTVH